MYSSDMMKFSRLSTSLIFVLFLIYLVAGVTNLSAQLVTQEIPDLEQRVIYIFKKNCTRAGCHAGTYPQMGLKLTETEFYGKTVNRPSVEMPDLMRVKPGVPDSSYLVMKILGTKDIKGLRMPFGRKPLSEGEVATIIEWVKSLTAMAVTGGEETRPEPLLPFRGWKVVNTPTPRMLDSGTWLFLIGHRFFPKLNSGYDTFFGLDGSGIIFLNLGYAISNKLFINLGRSNASDNVEFDLKYGLKQQFPEDKLPLAVALQATVNWISEKTPGKDRLRSEAFKLSGQVILSSEVFKRVAINVVPGILFNPDIQQEDEDPLITIGLGGRMTIYGPFSIIGEWVPIVSGYTLTSTFGEFNRFDSWGAGLEVWIGGHVFQIVVTNSAGLTTDQYMRGGGLDIEKGDLRLGFNIFRMLQF